MGRELPVFSVTQPAAQEEEVSYSRVFCLREECPPLKILLDFLKSRNQIPLIAKMDPAALDDWAWIHISLGYNRERKPVELFCLRDQGGYHEEYQKERDAFLHSLSMFDDVEATLAQEYVTRARFIIATRMLKHEITEEAQDFNGWILEFFQENCNGIVQIDGQGFFSPKGELVVDMQELPE